MRTRRGKGLIAGGLIFVAAGIALTGSATASRGLQTGFGDSLFTSSDHAVRNAWFARAAQADASIIRVNIPWSLVAPNRPANPTKANDPGYFFGALDGIVTDGVAHGLSPLLTVVGAPAWAEGPHRPAGAPAGSWRPQADQLGNFGQALAERYSGSFRDSSGAVLPRVSLFQAWNEPNLSTYLTPQWRGHRPVAPALYRGMLNAFYSGVKAVHPDDLVLTAGTAPYGDRPGGQRTRPVTFWRNVFCLRQAGRRLRRTKCKKPAHLDILAHHPINTIPVPGRPARNPDDAASADLGRIRNVLRAAERAHTIRPKGHRPLWATEFWWDTNPPDAAYGVSPDRQARFIEQELFLIWRGGGSAAIALQIGDAPLSVNTSGLILHSGIFNADGSPKPSFIAFRFPFVVQRRNRSAAIAWGKSPATGVLSIERFAHGGWRTIRSLQVGAGQVFTARLKARGRRTLRASVAGTSSLPWTVTRR